MKEKLICIIVLTALISCNTTEPEKNKLEISAEDVSCTEAWINVTGQTGNEVILNRDDKEVQRFTLTSSPQTIYDDSLHPNKTYNYQAIKSDEVSNKVTVTTLDTTSNNFIWQTWTFGDASAGSSALYDCKIISEENIWCVGEIYITDTSENGFTTYNAMHWNGNHWELKRIIFSYPVLYPNSRGDTIGISPIKSIFDFSGNDIWFTAGTVQHWNGKEFHQYQGEYAGFSNKIWGNNSSNLYFIGNNGTIIHYEAGQWNKTESGTYLPFQDVWGDNGEVLAIASDKFGFGGQYLISLSGNSVKQIKTDIQTASSFSSIWFKTNRKYFLAGNGVYTKHNLSDSAWEIDPVSVPLETYFYSIRGSGLNNIVAVGEGSYIAHFNGVNWKVYDELQSPLDRLSSVAVTENMIVAVGNKYVSGIENYGVIYIGRRK